MAHAKPLFAGTLRARPPASLLVAILDGKCEGTLVVEELRGADSLKSAYYFAAGAPAKARTAEPVVHLGRLLVELGKIDGSTHEVFEKEALLKEASLLPPDIVKLGNALGVTTLTLEEFNYCLE